MTESFSETSLLCGFHQELFCSICYLTRTFSNTKEKFERHLFIENFVIFSMINSTFAHKYTIKLVRTHRANLL